MKPFHSIGSLCVILQISLCGHGQSSIRALERDSQTRRGLVVEEVAKHAQGQKVGMHPGDVLLTWKRGNERGEFASPFDLSYVFLEQASRGSVTVVALRGDQRHEWHLGSDTWGFSTRPNLSGPLLSIYRQGESLFSAGKLSEATERFRAAAAAVHEGAIPWLGPWFLSHAGRVLAAAQQWELSDAVYQEAIAQAAEAGPVVRAELFRQRATGFEGRQDLTSAVEYYNNLLEESRKFGSKTMIESNCLTSLAVVELRQGDYDRAEEHLRHAMIIDEALAPSSIQTVLTVANLAVAYQDQGQLEKAEAYYLKALAKEEKYFPFSVHLEGTLNDLGVLFDQQGDLARAEAYDRRALSVAERLGSGSLDVADILANLAECLLEEGQPSQAEMYQTRALAIRERTAPDGLPSAYSLAGLGKIARIRGDLTKAEEFYARSLAIAARVNAPRRELASFFIGLAAVLRDRRDLSAAEHLYREALTSIETEDPYSIDRATTLAELAGTVFRQTRLNEAAELYQQSLSIFENRALHIGGIEETRSQYRAENIRYQKDYIELLIEQGRPEMALEVLEGSRARTLFEMLTQAHVDIRRGGDAATRARELQLRRRLNVKAARRIQIAGAQQTDKELKALDKEMEAILLQYQQVEAQLRASNPDYATLSRPEKLGIAEIEKLLDPNTLLLEYSLGVDRSYVWAVTDNSVGICVLPRRAEIETAANRFYRLLTRRNRPTDERAGDEDSSNGRYLQAANKLSAMLLGPVARLISGKRLLIVSDGALQYVPFAALPTPGGDARGIPLVVKHEIVSLPSASILAELRRQRMGRPKAAGMVAVLADPVFDPHDERIKTATGKPSPSGSPTQYTRDLTRSTRDLGLAKNGRYYLNRLPYTRNEANAVIAATPPGKGMVALDFAASRPTATSAVLAQYRVVHFATHGILNNKHPELSGLVLSLVNKQGEAQNGFLKLQDIYNLKLPVDLVVLSGCETGIGQEIRGEGLISLTRGFMYAGASRVVASLWSVSDMATVNLMAEFYRAMERDGMPPAAALRKAQIQMWRQRQWRSPYYWAAFQIQGEWQ